MSASGALFDTDKLNDVSKTVISRMKVDEVVEHLLTWAKEYDPEFYAILNSDIDRTKAIYNIDRETPKPRKDIIKWSDAKNYAEYMFNELYKAQYDLPAHITAESAVKILEAYKSAYDPEHDNSQWFETIKNICPAANFATDTKAYKAEPEKYAGSPGDASTIIRVSITGRTNTPDLCSIMKVLGKDECVARMTAAIEHFKNI